MGVLLLIPITQWVGIGGEQLIVSQRSVLPVLVVDIGYYYPGAFWWNSLLVPFLPATILFVYPFFPDSGRQANIGLLIVCCDLVVLLLGIVLVSMRRVFVAF